MTHSEACNILGVPPSSNLDDIKRAFRNLAKDHHPDRGGDHDTFTKINNAYEFLQKGSNSSTEFDMNDIFSTFFNGNHSFSNDGSFRSRPRRPSQTSRVSVLLEDVFREATITLLDVLLPQSCTHCDGVGRIGNDCVYCRGTGRSPLNRRQHPMFILQNSCDYCHGTGKSDACPECTDGWVYIPTKFNIKLPKFLKHQFVIRNNDNGVDLIVDLIIPPYYTLENDQLIYSPPVDLVNVINGYKQTLLGKEFEVVPFTFNDSIVEGVIYRPMISVKDQSLFSHIKKCPVY